MPTPRTRRRNCRPEACGLARTQLYIWARLAVPFKNSARIANGRLNLQLWQHSRPLRFFVSGSHADALTPAIPGTTPYFGLCLPAATESVNRLHGPPVK
jgi:hypothetical protein